MKRGPERGTEILANPIYANANDTTDSGSDVHYVDLAKDISLNELLFTAPSKKISFGSEDHDVRKGTDPLLGNDDVTDRLYGLAGNDTLTGFGGEDYLEEGEDLDALNGGTGNSSFYGGIRGDNLAA
jgi:Ca2+-binding RTX toxin-like protein